MILVPTRVCNTNSCNYCGVYKKDFDYLYFAEENMDVLFEKIFFLSTRLHDSTLRFFGGEPLLRFDTIRNIVTYFRLKTDRFQYVINTNLVLLDDEILAFVKENNIKIIVSCNGDVITHSKGRWVSIKETLETYENIKKITSNGVDHQINIVVQNENASILDKNLAFIHHSLGGKNINLLPVNYRGWTDEWLEAFGAALERVKDMLANSTLDIYFINKEVKNDVSLFNSEFVIDSNGGIYPSMVILETFFLKEKEKIRVSSLAQSLSDIEQDFQDWDDSQHKIYSLFINKFLKKKFPDILEKDNESSTIFHRFLMQI